MTNERKIEKKSSKEKSRQNKNWFLPLYSKQSLVQDFLRLSIPKLLLCLFWPQYCHLQALAWPWVALKKSREKKLNLGILLAWTLNRPARVGTCLEFFSFILKQLGFLALLILWACKSATKTMIEAQALNIYRQYEWEQ